MQALEIIIPGAFYDSQIYDDRLYLWGIDGSLTLIDWNLLVEKIHIPEGLEAVLKFALQYGDDLYANLLMKDIEVRELIKSKFQKLSQLKVEIKKQDLDNCITSQQDSPLPFPHADSAIHYKTMYVGGQSGVSASKCNTGRGRKQRLKTAEKLFDMPVLSISASHLTLAVAAGSEGLFDYSLVSKSGSKKHNEPRALSNDHCNLARWMYPSIFGSSYFNDGYFADFKQSKRSKAEKEKISQEMIQLVLPETAEISAIEEDEIHQSASQYKREFTKIIPLQEIFKEDDFELDVKNTNTNNQIFTWGVQDKICLATENSISLVQYSSKARTNSQKFRGIGSVNIEELNDQIVSADSSLFGVVLEKDDGLLVISSSLETYFLEGEPINWRVFPKSKNYTNQLHVLGNDALYIYSFNHDYFVDQSTKKIGISANSKKK